MESDMTPNILGTSIGIIAGYLGVPTITLRKVLVKTDRTDRAPSILQSLASSAGCGINSASVMFAKGEPLSEDKALDDRGVARKGVNERRVMAMVSREQWTIAADLNTNEYIILPTAYVLFDNLHLGESWRLGDTDWEWQDVLGRGDR